NEKALRITRIARREVTPQTPSTWRHASGIRHHEINPFHKSGEFLDTPYRTGYPRECPVPGISRFFSASLAPPNKDGRHLMTRSEESSDGRITERDATYTHGGRQ